MDYRRIITNSIRLYFAPLVGAYKGWRAEMLRYRRQYSGRKEVAWKAI